MIDNFYIDRSFDGYELLRINKNNKWAYIGSKYNIKKEIDLIQKNIKNTSSLKSILVFGAANGTWIEDIDEITSGKEILIVEPNKDLFKAFIEKKHNVNNNIVKTICMEDENFYQNMISGVKLSNFVVLVFANYDVVYKEEFQKFIDKVEWMITDIQVGENTSKFFSEIWFKSYFSNLPYIMNAQSVNSYKNLFKNKPAVIVSAGPSLDKNLKFLKGNEDKFIIITAGRTLNTLREEGIKADFTCVIDASDAMYNVFKPSLDMNVPLLFNEETSEKIVSEYKGDKIFFNTREFSNADSEILGINTEKLFQGGSVVHACTSFARLLGCDPITFIGQDLAYTNNKLHSENSKADYESNSISDSNMYIKGVVEEKVLTNYDLNIFRERLEMLIKFNRDRTFVNCTEGGAHIEGTLVKKLNDFIGEHNEVIDKTCVGKCEKLNISRESVIDKLKSISYDVKDAVILCEKAKKLNDDLVDLYLKGTGKYNRAIDKLDKIDEEIKSKKGFMYLFETLTKPINNELIKKFADRGENYNSITDKIQSVAEKGQYLNDEFIKVFNFGKALIDECITSLEELK